MSDIQALDRAFSTLAGQGIISRHNFWCCGGCGHNGLANWYATADEKDKDATVGYVFYHEQFAENAINGYGLTLCYGALPSVEDGGRGDTRAIGEKIAAALREQGFTVDWDGNPRSTIKVPRFYATLDEIPRGEGNTLHDDRDEVVFVLDEDED